MHTSRLQSLNQRPGHAETWGSLGEAQLEVGKIFYSQAPYFLKCSCHFSVWAQVKGKSQEWTPTHQCREAGLRPPGQLQFHHLKLCLGAAVPSKEVKVTMWTFLELSPPRGSSTLNQYFLRWPHLTSGNRRSLEGAEPRFLLTQDAAGAPPPNHTHSSRSLSRGPLVFSAD